MIFFRKIFFIFGILLSLISINALISYRTPKKDKEIGKDY